MPLNHLPKAPSIRKGRNTFKNDLRRARRQRAVGHVGVASDPANVGGAPKHVRRLQVKGPIHRQLGPQQIAAGAVLHTFGFAGGAGGVQHKEWVLGTDKFRLANRRGFGSHFVHQTVAPSDHVARGGRALVHDDILNRLAAAHVQAFVNDGFQGQFFTAAQLVVGGDDGYRTSVHDAFLQAFG